MSHAGVSFLAGHPAGYIMDHAILQQVSADPPVYTVELPFSFKGVKRVDVPEERIHRT